MDLYAGGATSFPGEFERVADADEPIRQGDVIQLIASSGSEEWGSHFGVILTANCDLVHKKHGGVLSYVPVVPVDVYVRAITVPRMIQSDLDKAMDQLSDLLPGESGWPTKSRLIEMIELSGSPDSACASLPTDDRSEPVAACLKKIGVCAVAAAACAQASSIEQILAAADEQRRAFREIDGHKSLPPLDNLLKDLRERLTRTLPGDALFLECLSETYRAGYIAYLRLIREIRHDSIATSAVEEARLQDQASARRVSRLQLLYLHRLAQQMSRVFSDIGLPDQYERNRSLAVDSRAESWREVTTNHLQINGTAK